MRRASSQDRRLLVAVVVEEAGRERATYPGSCYVPWKEVNPSSLRLKVKVPVQYRVVSFEFFQTQKESERRGSVEVLTVAVERMEEFAALLHRI